MTDDSGRWPAPARAAATTLGPMMIWEDDDGRLQGALTNRAGLPGAYQALLDAQTAGPALPTPCDAELRYQTDPVFHARVYAVSSESGMSRRDVMWALALDDALRSDFEAQANTP